METEIIELLRGGKKLDAIKRCQEIAEISFQEAKRYVEEIEQGLKKEIAQSENKTEPDARPSPITNSEVRNDNNFNLKWKILIVLLILVLIKGCTYQTHGGEEMGSITQIVFKIVDTVIPWPSRADTYVYEEVPSDTTTQTSEAVSGEVTFSDNEILYEESDSYNFEGNVIDGNDGASIKGGNIYVSGNKEHVIVSDENGYFKIEGLSKDAVIVFEFPDYKSKEIKVSELINSTPEEALSIVLEKKSLEDYVYEDNN